MNSDDTRIVRKLQVNKMVLKFPAENGADTNGGVSRSDSALFPPPLQRSLDVSLQLVPQPVLGQEDHLALGSRQPTGENSIMCAGVAINPDFWWWCDVQRNGN